MRVTSLLGLLLASTPSILAKSKKNDAVLLSKVKSLTLRDGEYTSHRRVEALPQLNCVGGNAKGLYNVDVMRCTNSGSEYDAEDIQWTCKASLPPEFKLGSTEVICEGYDNADDPFVLKGSCGVEYRLMLTDLGEEKYRDRMNQRPWKSRNKDSSSGSDTPAAVIFWIVFAVIVCILLYSICFPSGNVGAPRRGFGDGFRRGYGGGGGGGDDNDDPPPPYTPRAPKPKSYGSTYTGSNRYGSSRQQNQPWRPGFWSGTAAGAAAGYAAGSYANRQDRNQARPGTSNWFGGTNTSPLDRPAPRNDYGGGSWGGGSNSAGPSSSRHESTGFGGTRRR